MRESTKTTYRPSCMLCGGETSLIFREKCIGEFVKQIFRCRKCGLGFVAPFPSEEVLQKFYDQSDYFYSSLRSDGTPDFKGTFPLFIVDEIFRNISLSKNSHFKLLDIGSGTGDFLREVKFRYPHDEALGLETSKWAVNYSRKRGLKIVEGFFENAAKTFQDHSFHMVSAFEVIEHLRDPFSFLSRVSRILKPDGYLVFSTPDFRSPVYRMRLTHALRFNEEHLFYFNNHNLRILLEKADFSVLRVKRIGGSLCTGLLAHHQEDISRGNFKNHMRYVLKHQPLVNKTYRLFSSYIGISSLFVIAQKRPS